MLEPATARTKAYRVIYQMLELTKGQLDSNDVLALGYYMGVAWRENEPTTLHAAIARSSGNKAKAEREDVLLIVQEIGHVQFRWWSFDPHDRTPHPWENETGADRPYTTSIEMIQHFKNLGFDADAAIWMPV